MLRVAVSNVFDASGDLMRRLLVILGSAAVLAFGGTAFADEAAQEPSPSAVFVQKAALNALTEVELGKLAGTNARASGISALGFRLARDHAKMNAMLALISRDKGIDVPVELDEEHRAIVDRLGAMSGAEFDTAYAALMASDHSRAIMLFSQAAEGDDPLIAEFARRTLPSLREHKRLADVYVVVTSNYRPEAVASRKN
jgi:predicted outer membrane protein